MPVKLLSRKFRGKFLALLKQSHGGGELTLKGSLAPYSSQAAFKTWLSPLYAKEWVVYAKPPWNGPQQVLKYLADQHAFGWPSPIDACYRSMAGKSPSATRTIAAGTGNPQDHTFGHRVHSSFHDACLATRIRADSLLRVPCQRTPPTAAKRIRQLSDAPDEERHRRTRPLEQEQDPAPDQCPRRQQGPMTLIEYRTSTDDPTNPQASTDSTVVLPRPISTLSRRTTDSTPPYLPNESKSRNRYIETTDIRVLRPSDPCRALLAKVNRHSLA